MLVSQSPPRKQVIWGFRTDRQTAEQGQARGLSFKNCQVRVPFRKTPSENCAWNLGFQPPRSFLPPLQPACTHREESLL